MLPERYHPALQMRSGVSFSLGWLPIYNGVRFGVYLSVHNLRGTRSQASSLLPNSHSGLVLACEMVLSVGWPSGDLGSSPASAPHLWWDLTLCASSLKGGCWASLLSVGMGETWGVGAGFSQKGREAWSEGGGASLFTTLLGLLASGIQKMCSLWPGPEQMPNRYLWTTE